MNVEAPLLIVAARVRRPDPPAVPNSTILQCLSCEREVWVAPDTRYTLLVRARRNLDTLLVCRPCLNVARLLHDLEEADKD